MQGSRHFLKTRCGTVHYISPEVAKGDPYVGMASDIWSVGIILYAMVTATLPFDAPTSVAVLKKIVRGDFHMPAHIPPDLQSLIRLMLTLDPKERITIPQIKQHQWYLGSKEETPRGEPEPETPYIISLDQIKENSDIVSNLKLLGWEESELMNDLLDQKLNAAKSFYKLLVENKSLPIDKNDNPKVIDKKVLRRRSVGAPARTAQIGVTADPTIIKINHDIKSKIKRSSQRAVRNSERPIRSEKRNSAAIDYQYHPAEPGTTGNPGVTGSPILITVNAAAPVKTTTTKNVVWGISPSNEPDSKKYSVESNKSVTQILESLKNCFADIGQYDISTKQTKNGIKVKARRSGKRHGSPVVKLNLIKQKEGETEIIIKGGGGKSKEEFKELAKKVEETLVV
jgi:serine/threonine protein kinase